MMLHSHLKAAIKRRSRRHAIVIAVMCMSGFAALLVANNEVGFRVPLYFFCAAICLLRAYVSRHDFTKDASMQAALVVIYDANDAYNDSQIERVKLGMKVVETDQALEFDGALISLHVSVLYSSDKEKENASTEA